MAEEPDNIILEHLRAMRASIDRLHNDNREIKARLNEVYAAVVSVRRDQANDAEKVSRLEVVFDRVLDRLDRVEQRLQLRDA